MANHHWSLTLALSCRGLKVLVDLLDEDYHEQADLVANALVGVGSVFELQVRQNPFLPERKCSHCAYRVRLPKTISAGCSFVKGYSIPSPLRC